MSGEQVSNDSETKPSDLTERAAKKEEARTSGKNLLGITYIAEDFGAPLPDEILRDFGL